MKGDASYNYARITGINQYFFKLIGTYNCYFMYQILWYILENIHIKRKYFLSLKFIEYIEKVFNRIYINL